MKTKKRVPSSVALAEAAIVKSFSASAPYAALAEALIEGATKHPNKLNSLIGAAAHALPAEPCFIAELAKLANATLDQAAAHDPAEVAKVVAMELAMQFDLRFDVCEATGH